MTKDWLTLYDDFMSSYRIWADAEDVEFSGEALDEVMEHIREASDILHIDKFSRKPERRPAP